MNNFRNTYAEINLDNLQHNIEILKSIHSRKKFFCPMVKGNGYGHGDIEITKVFEKMGITHVGVSLVEEGIKLREAGIKLNILVFGGFGVEGAKNIIKHKLTPVISAWKHFDSILANDIKDYPVHIKFNTGMNRLGFSLLESNQVLEKIEGQSKLKLEGVLTHLINSEDKALSQIAIDAFLKTANLFERFAPYIHAVNSGGLLQGFDVGVRPGIACYGYGPSKLNLKPVMTLKSAISAVHQIKKGESVSYTATWVASRDSKIATVSIGYADGYRRDLSSKGFVFYKGQKAKIVGTICMDFLMIDITDIDDSLSSSEEVILFGDNGPDISEIAALAQTISYDLLVSISARVPRIYLGGKNAKTI